MSPIAICLLCSAAQAEIRPEVPPTQGAEAVIAVLDESGDPRSGETVRVIHRPGLAGEKELAIGITDGRGRVRWTPELAGIARIRAGDETTIVRIAPEQTDPGVAFLLALLGVLAVGAILGGSLERS